MSRDSDSVSIVDPVRKIPSDRHAPPPAEGVGLCLSGGGFRAMLFHTGVLWRLHDAGILRDIARISSVSGGSIIAGWLGLKWNELYGTSPGSFDVTVVNPIRELAARTLDRGSILRGMFLPGSINNKVVKALRKRLFGNATLQDLPDDNQGPRFVINATNVQSGALMRFMKPYMRDWRVGEVKNPTLAMAFAVAASAAFPPVLSPAYLELKQADFTPNTGDGLQFPPYTTNLYLTDGGVYDNLGLETVWKRYKTVLVSDAGGQMKSEEHTHRDWVRHIFRVLNVIDNQVRNLRKRQVMGSFIDRRRAGAFWDMRMDIAEWSAPSTLPCPHANTMALAGVKTRLKKLDANTQERLINWGYAISDAAVRSHYDKNVPAPADFPYPGSRV